MTLAPRAVLVHRRTELDELLARHGTRGQAAFFLATRGRRLDEVEARHGAMTTAIAAVMAAVPLDWRRGAVERDDLARFLFAPDDVVIVVGQDGLVANVAKYLDGQRVVGINPDPARNPGVLVRHPPEAVPDLLRSAAGDAHTMVEALTDDGQSLLALNEIYLGHASHQTSRYVVTVPGEDPERQASSGLIVATGTGGTGWCRSAWLERHSPLALPDPHEQRLLWFVREAWPSPATGTAHTEGEIVGARLAVTVESDQLVAFGDGIEADHLTLSWGQTVTIGCASRQLHLV